LSIQCLIEFYLRTCSKKAWSSSTSFKKNSWWEGNQYKKMLWILDTLCGFWLGVFEWLHETNIGTWDWTEYPSQFICKNIYEMKFGGWIPFISIVGSCSYQNLLVNQSLKINKRPVDSQSPCHFSNINLAWSMQTLYI